MLDVPALLLTGLEELTEEQLKTFQSHLTIGRMLDFPPIPESQLENTDRQVTVDQMVKRYDPEGAVRNTIWILREMDRDDLAEKLERDHTRVLLLTTLQELTEDQLKTFQSSGRMLGFPLIPESQLENTDRQDTVDQMVMSYGPEGAVSNTIWILMEMDRHDVAEKLERDHTRATTWWRDSSDSDKWRRRKEGAVMRRRSMLDVPALLLTSLEELTEEQLKTFQSYLTSGRMLGFPPIPESQLENTDRQDTVDQMVKRYDPEGAVRNTIWILREMDRDDLAEKLERDHTRVLLLTTLQELTEDQLKTFQSSGRMLGFPLIPESQLENTDRQDTVDQMVMSYGPEGAVRNTIWILMEMDRHDVAEKLERDHTRAWLLNSLEELNINELKTFQNHLTSGKRLGFPPMPKSQLENTDRQVTVDLMMKIYDPERAVKITLSILRWMNDHDLTEKLQSDHTEPSGPEEAVEITPEILKKMNWDDLSKKIERERFPEDFEPEDYDQEDNRTYRFQCPSAGLFQCSITGLVFRMEGEGEVLYMTVPWDRKLLAQCVKRPAGPLFKFRCLKGSVCQLHLPHCEICPGGGCDFLSVAHVTDDNIEFIPPHKITETHVIINIYGFCAYGLIKDKDAPVFPIKAQVLLFYHPSDDPELEPVLHVLLLPRNVVLMKVQEERARRNGMRETFIETTSDCELTPDQIYSLSTDGYHKVTPKNKKFDNDKDYENYTTTFAVFLPAKIKKAELTLKKKKNIAWSILDLLSSLFVNHEYPWKGFYRHQAPLPAATPTKPPTFPGQDFIPKHRIALETRLGLLQPILLHLEDHKVLNAEEREEVVSKSTKTLQNQALLGMVVRKGDEAQEKFYQVLREADHFLVRDLEKKKA
ncbi:uncharacterized protein LOC118378724 isoform X2 [Oncorhynchus keta]|uniref:uncharacterized protein LOC118378724 isoform X2 n=1 Tax=Oncorhynchus keta TaxID=8018 RepID=UPI00227D1A86|nr:uncharacterized protein LOC118378724 isoform X2 [Oncorhynchus keta]